MLCDYILLWRKSHVMVFNTVSNMERCCFRATAIKFKGTLTRKRSRKGIWGMLLVSGVNLWLKKKILDYLFKVEIFKNSYDARKFNSTEAHIFQCRFRLKTFTVQEANTCAALPNACRLNLTHPYIPHDIFFQTVKKMFAKNDRQHFSGDTVV
jgi:hypothetical protein